MKTVLIHLFCTTNKCCGVNYAEDQKLHIFLCPLMYIICVYFMPMRGHDQYEGVITVTWVICLYLTETTLILMMLTSVNNKATKTTHAAFW